MSGADTSRTAVYAAFAGRRRRFQLRLGEAEELERLCQAGIGAINWRLAALQYRLADVRETIRLGLVGGGEGQAEATALVMSYVDDVPVLDNLKLAGDIVAAFNAGAPEPDQGNGQAERRSDPATSPTSTGQEPPAGSPLTR